MTRFVPFASYTWNVSLPLSSFSDSRLFFPSYAYSLVEPSGFICLVTLPRASRSYHVVLPLRSVCELGSPYLLMPPDRP